MANQHTGPDNRTTQAVYQILCDAAEHGSRMPSLNEMAPLVGVNSASVGEHIKRLAASGLIVIHQETRFTRFVEIVATGKRTLPSKMPTFSNCIPTNPGGWPKRDMTPEGFSAAIGAIGRFEDSLAARRDRGTNGMPPRGELFSSGGISDVYGSRGVRTGAGAQL